MHITRQLLISLFLATAALRTAAIATSPGPEVGRPEKVSLVELFTSQG